jgi:hypothetical protein
LIDQILKCGLYGSEAQGGKRLVAQHGHAGPARGAKRGVAILTE